MTEAEAKTKWCPFVRILDWNGIDEPSGSDRGIAAVNRHQADGNGIDCIASACMAWRIVSPAQAAVIERCETNAPVDAVPPRPEGQGWVLVDEGTDEPGNGFPAPRWSTWERQSTPFIPSTGYCGLAGKP